jgi:alanyl-tRNA synthetase
VEKLARYFEEDPARDCYLANVDVNGNMKVCAPDLSSRLSLNGSQILQSVVLQGKKLEKAVYLFSIDTEGNKVVHVNHSPANFRSKGLDARIWASKVAEVLGGKVRF